MNIIYPSLLTLLVASLPPAAYAQGPTDRNQPGWDVTLSLNSFYVRDKSQMNTNDDNAITTDLQQSGTSTSELLFAHSGMCNTPLPREILSFLPVKVPTK